MINWLKKKLGIDEIESRIIVLNDRIFNKNRELREEISVLRDSSKPIVKCRDCNDTGLLTIRLQGVPSFEGPCPYCRPQDILWEGFHRCHSCDTLLAGQPYGQLIILNWLMFPQCQSCYDRKESLNLYRLIKNPKFKEKENEPCQNF